MKLKYIVLAAAVLVVLAAGFSMIRPDAAPVPKTVRIAAEASEPRGNKALVVYFSYTGNTRALAQTVQKNTGGDLFEIEPLTPYSTDYKTVESQGKREVESGYLPPLKTKVENLASYDVIFVGSPIWWYTVAPPVAAFLTDPALKGKTIIPFVTHGGYGGGQSAEDIKKLAPQSNVLDALVLRGSGSYEDAEIADWLKKVGFAK